MTGHTFVARWELDEEGIDMPLRHLKREACRGAIQELLAEVGAELLVEPEQMDWRVDANNELVATGPARRRVGQVAA